MSFHGGIGIPLESSHISTAKAALIKILNENLITNLFVYIGGCTQDCLPADTRWAKLTCVECGGMDCIYLGYDTLQWRIFCEYGSETLCSKKANIFLNIKVIPTL